MPIKLVELIEKWFDDNSIQHMHSGIVGTLEVSVRCWTCAPTWGRWVNLSEDRGQVILTPAFNKPQITINAADPQLFPKLLNALNRCEHMRKGL